eukprot:scaffold3133_cov108-Skeletonema_marinoi.AAC.1
MPTYTFEENDQGIDEANNSITGESSWDLPSDDASKAVASPEQGNVAVESAAVDVDNLTDKTLCQSSWKEKLHFVQRDNPSPVMPRVRMYVNEVEGEDVPTLFQEMMAKDGERGAGVLQEL